jgi:hypothetical protein
MRFVAGEEAVFAGGSLGGVELGGVLEAEHAELAFFHAEPAFVADVGVTAALVEGGEHALHVAGCAAGRIQPGPVATAGLDVALGVALADLGQARPGGVEAAQILTRVSPRIVGASGAFWDIGNDAQRGVGSMVPWPWWWRPIGSLRPVDRWWPVGGGVAWGVGWGPGVVVVAGSAAEFAHLLGSYRLRATAA